MYGGLPFVLFITSEEAKIKYLTSLIKNTYLKDVIERHKVHGDVIMETLMDILSSDIGSFTNPTKLVNTFTSNSMKVTDKTISTYIDYLIDAFLISKASRYDIKGKKYIGSPYKYYFVDIGLRNARINFRQQEGSHIMENILYNELIIRGFNVDVGIVERYYRDDNGKHLTSRLEVDFVCNKGSRRIIFNQHFPFQIKKR